MHSLNICASVQMLTCVTCMTDQIELMLHVHYAAVYVVCVKPPWRKTQTAT